MIVYENLIKFTGNPCEAGYWPISWVEGVKFCLDSVLSPDRFSVLTHSCKRFFFRKGGGGVIRPPSHNPYWLGNPTISFYIAYPKKIEQNISASLWTLNFEQIFFEKNELPERNISCEKKINFYGLGRSYQREVKRISFWTSFIRKISSFQRYQISSSPFCVTS